LTSTSSRIEWVDAAKALAIVLVVVFHVSGWVFWTVFGDRVPAWTNPWSILSDVLIPIRIPLFFLMSGVLAYRAVRRPWATLLSTRISDVLWPFALWSILIAPLWHVRLRATGADASGQVLEGLFSGGTHLWFLTALALFIAVGKLTWRAPRLTLIVAACLAFIFRYPAAEWVNSELPAALAQNVDRWLLFLFWFLLGCSAREAIFWVAARPWWFALGGTAVVVAGASTAAWIPEQSYLPIVAFAGVAALVAWSVLAVRVRVIARISRYLAPRTLSVYVGHAFLLEVFAIGVMALQGTRADWFLGSTTVAVLFVPVLTALLVFIATWFYDRCTQGAFAWVFQPPWRSRTVSTRTGA
jgi:uncharacterized membrane protein YcfT